MKKILLTLVTGLTFTSVNAAGITLKATDKLGEVNGETFYVSDWNAEFMMLPQNVKKQGQDKLFVPIRNSIIEKMAIKDQAEKAGLKDSIDYKSAIRKAERDILTRLYFDKKMGKPITQGDLKKEYNKLKKDMAKNKQVKARHILVKTRNDADKIIKALNAGNDFASLAKTHSKGPTGKKGGDLGWVSRGQMVPSFDKALFELKDGAITKRPVKTQFGWHIIKREKSRSQKAPTFKEAKEFLEGRLRQARAQKVIQDAISKSKVTVFDEKGNPIKQ
ncbi:MAG: peptidylprolyl isomerase [Alphaproteobacteria bacterium]